MTPIEFHSVKKFQDDIYSLNFTSDKPFRYLPGQFIELHIPHEYDDRGDKRWFTLSSAPHEKLLTFTTRIATGSSYKKQLLSLQKGDVVQVSQPLGDFVLPKNTAIPIVCIAFGVGITPFRSIILEMKHKHEQRDLQLTHFARTPLFEDELRPYYQYNQAIDALSISDDHYVYIAGPEAAVEQTVETLVSKQIKRSQIYTDFFHGYSVI